MVLKSKPAGLDVEEVVDMNTKANDLDTNGDNDGQSSFLRAWCEHFQGGAAIPNVPEIKALPPIQASWAIWPIEVR